MYDGFDRDLRRALDAGDDAVATFIQQTAAARNLDPFEVFAATARRRLAWEREAERPEPPRRSRRKRTRRPRPGRVLRWPGRNPLARLFRVTSSQAGRALGRATRRVLTTGGRAAWRHTRRMVASSSQALRRTTARWGEYAYALGHWLVHCRWPSPTPRDQGRRRAPQPSPAVAAFLDGYSVREATYLYGERDPAIRDPRDDWPGALRDFQQAVRAYVFELQRYAEEDTHDRDQHPDRRRSAQSQRARPAAPRGGAGPRP